jgi:hypothetical protein
VLLRRYSSRRAGSLAGLTFLCAATGALALCDGFYTAVREESRARYGHVTSGVVIERFSPAGENGTRAIGGRRRWGNSGRSTVKTTGFDLYQQTARLLLTGSTDGWVIDYRFPCSVGRGTCYGRDFVDRELWAKVRAGDTINVRQSAGETTTARLDENPQTPLALVKTAMACVLFALACAFAGRFRLVKPKYTKVPAVVTSVEPVKYGEDTRWKVRFAYFDGSGTARESIDEVNDPSWRVEDECVAVYRPQAPDLATLQPLPRS